jgi:hypothetical protein
MNTLKREYGKLVSAELDTMWMTYASMQDVNALDRFVMIQDGEYWKKYFEQNKSLTSC